MIRQWKSSYKNNLIEKFLLIFHKQTNFILTVTLMCMKYASSRQHLSTEFIIIIFTQKFGQYKNPLYIPIEFNSVNFYHYSTSHTPLYFDRFQQQKNDFILSATWIIFFLIKSHQPPLNLYQTNQRPFFRHSGKKNQPRKCIPVNSHQHTVRGLRIYIIQYDTRKTCDSFNFPRNVYSCTKLHRTVRRFNVDWLSTLYTFIVTV